MYYYIQSKFNCVYWRWCLLPKIKDKEYVINIDELKSIETYWIALYVNGNNETYFDNFCVEHIQKKVKNSLETKRSQQILKEYKHKIR